MPTDYSLLTPKYGLEIFWYVYVYIRSHSVLLLLYSLFAIVKFIGFASMWKTS